MRSVGSHSRSGREKEENKERKGQEWAMIANEEEDVYGRK